MCCMFTYCEWILDLVQRFWTFIMSFCISSAICCMLITASMSGVVLGYNYSLAEYMDLKETNVLMKRGIFDNEIGDNNFKRLGDLPVPEQLKEKEEKVRTKPSHESTSLRSRHRLDDSILETADQHQYKGDVMRLKINPTHSSTSLLITDAAVMANIKTIYAKDLLDSLKAIKGDSVRNKYIANQHYGGTTIPPMRTFAFNKHEHLYHNAGSGRRLIPNIDSRATHTDLARLPVTGVSKDSRLNWQAPKISKLLEKAMKDILAHEEITHLSPIKLNVGSLRSSTTEIPGQEAPFLSRPHAFTLFSRATVGSPNIVNKFSNEESFKERFRLDNEMMSRKRPRPKSEYEYGYDIKDLPVRKRRSME